MYDWLRVTDLTERSPYAVHSRDVFDSVLDMSEKIALEQFAPLNRLLDEQEPRYVDRAVVLPEGVQRALSAYAESGLLAAGHAEHDGGMQLPYIIDMAANTFFAFHSVSLYAYAMLTYANANLLMAHGTAMQKEAFAMPQLQGRYFGTMCLSEPSAGSSLGDITSKATPDGEDYLACPLGPRYRIKGSKMWISGAEHDLNENIMHLVLAKIPEEDGRLPAGTRGISLFVVSKYQVDDAGALTDVRNDVVLTGLNHKLGYRGIPNTLLSFGDREGAVGYRIGEPGQGLALMFHMMNEARINVGMGATMLGYAGYEASLSYAQERRQGHGRSKDGAQRGSQQVRIIEHADVRRMLLAQKAYSEGALALVLYCARLVDDKRSGDDRQQERAAALLELLTPIAKSWPSEWCLEANSLAIQVLGGAGYTRDFSVEQYWRDNRLNMIHEGTHGIQAIDLLSRKVRQNGGGAFDLWADEVRQTIAMGRLQSDLARHAEQLSSQLECLVETTRKAGEPRLFDLSISHATPYMQAFGHIVIAWLWLQVVAALANRSNASTEFASGKRAAMQYFFAYELPRSAVWLQVLRDEDDTVSTMKESWF